MKKVKDDKTNAVACEDYRDAIMKIVEEIRDPDLLKKIYEYAEHRQLHGKWNPAWLFRPDFFDEVHNHATAVFVQIQVGADKINVKIIQIVFFSDWLNQIVCITRKHFPFPFEEPERVDVELSTNRFNY